MRLIFVFAVVALAACAEEEGTPPDNHLCEPSPDPLIQPTNCALVLTSDYQTSSLDRFAAGTPEHMDHNLVVLSGDTALRNLGGRAAVLNRGIGSLVLLRADAIVEAEIGLPGCNPHDAVLLPSGEVAVSCYDAAALQLVDLATHTHRDGPSLADFADGDGLPEMDRLVMHGGRLYVTLQLLDRNNFYTPVGNGLVAVLDATTLAVVDADLNQNGTQALALPCENPFTALVALNDDRLAVGCSGDFSTLSSMAVAAVDPASGNPEVLADGNALNGSPTGLALDNSGRLHAVVSVPDPNVAFTTMEMRVLRFDPGTEANLYSSPGFSLAGIAFDAAGRLYVANRSTDATAGLYVIGGNTAGPFATGLPPLEIEVF